MSLEIREVKTKKALKAFVKFYTDLYKSNQQVAFPLHFDELATLSASNPALDHCKLKLWMVYDGKKVLGRIAAFINQLECEKEARQVGRFGWFDFVDSRDVSSLLMNTAIEWLNSEKAESLHGPLGFTDLDRQGSLIEGFEEHSTFATLYNYPYYADHYVALGFSKKADWVEYQILAEKDATDRITRIATYVSSKYHLREINFKSKKELKSYIPKVFQLLNISYKDLYGFVPLTEKQVEHYADMFLFLIKLDFISLVEDQNEKLVGFGLSLPSFTKAMQKAKGKLIPLAWIHLLKALKKNDTLDLYLLAVDPDYQNKGVNALIMNKIMKSAEKFGITNAESNIELEDNTKVQQMWRFFKHRQHKRRRCYYKNLGQ